MTPGRPSVSCAPTAPASPIRADRSLVVTAHPSLALTKYWGKAHSQQNLPATPSLAVTLDRLTTTTTVRAASSGEDQVRVDGHVQPAERFFPFFAAVRAQLPAPVAFQIDSRNDYPAAAGLASSAAGFAALAWGCCLLADRPERALASRLARIGSASAARSLYGGFVELPAGAQEAVPIHPSGHWPQLRVVVAITRREAKQITSRGAMEEVRRTSPFYSAWVAAAPALHREALAAVAARDLGRLGPLVQRSSYLMFATMLGALPPIRYWSPASLAVLDALAELRAGGVAAWETMDAGPQVKVVCLAADVPAVVGSLVAGADLAGEPVVCAPGEGAARVAHGGS